MTYLKNSLELSPIIQDSVQRDSLSELYSFISFPTKNAPSFGKTLRMGEGGDYSFSPPEIEIFM